MTTSFTEQVAKILDKNPCEMTSVIAHRLGKPEANILQSYPLYLCTELESSTRVIDLIKVCERPWTRSCDR